MPREARNSEQTLEVLTTSQTLVSTLRGYFSHRIFGIWTVILIVIWSLSPAGGQAVLRAVESEFHNHLHEYYLTYYPSDKVYYHLYTSPFTSGSGALTAKKDLHRVVDAAISSPDVAVLFSKGISPDFDAAVTRLGGEEQAAQSARTDPWGNVRIPFLHLLPDYNDDDRSQWVEIPPNEIAPYSSLIGHTIRKVPRSSIGNISVALQTFYHTLSCAPFFNGTNWLKQNPGRLLMHKQTNASVFTESVKTSGDKGNIFLDILLPETDQPQPRPEDAPENNVERAVLVFGVRGSMNSPMYTQIRMTHCDVAASYVETEVECVRASVGGALSCAALRMRERPDAPPSNWTSLNWGGLGGDYLAYIPNTIQSAHPIEPTGLELYLQDPPTSFSGYDLDDFSRIPLDVFQARLALILNSFWHASLEASDFLGADGVDGTPFEDLGAWFFAPQYGNTTGTWAEFTPRRYVIKYEWLALYLVATTVLAVCAIASVAFSALTRAPDLFCGVSSLTRDSAFMTRVPEGGSLLSGSDRARHLQDVWVRIQDVKPEDDVGRIAFSDQKELGAAAALRWERKYE